MKTGNTLAWAGSLLITFSVLTLNILARWFGSQQNFFALRREHHDRLHQAPGHNLNFYYGAFHALKNINMNIPAGKVTAFIGPSGCGKSTLLVHLQPHVQSCTRTCARRRAAAGQQNILGRHRRQSAAPGGHGVPEVYPVPDVDRQRCLLVSGQYERLPKSRMDDRIEWALKKAAWEEVKTSSSQSGHCCPAASNSVCASPAPWPTVPGSAAAGRTDLGADPISPPTEELVHELKELHHRHRHPICGRRRGCLTTPLIAYLGDPDRIYEPDAIFTAPKQKATEDCYHRQIQLIPKRSALGKAQTPRAHTLGVFVWRRRRRAFSASAQRAGAGPKTQTWRVQETVLLIALSPANAHARPLRPGTRHYPSPSSPQNGITPRHRHPRRQRIQLARIIGQHPHRLHPLNRPASAGTPRVFGRRPDGLGARLASSVSRPDSARYTP